MAKLLNDERETHINMVHGSSKMRIYTTEYNIMKKLDRYVENNENWKIVEVGMVHGEVVSKHMRLRKTCSSSGKRNEY